MYDVPRTPSPELPPRTPEYLTRHMCRRKVSIKRRFNRQLALRYTNFAKAQSWNALIDPLQHFLLMRVFCCQENAMNHTDKDKTSKTGDAITPDASRSLPADKCAICGKTIDEVGGARIVAQQARGVALSDKYLGGGNPERPYRSFRLDEDSNTYVVVWGEVGFWSDANFQHAVETYRAGVRPWFCQVCGKRTCHLCGAPINVPVGSNWIGDTGCGAHSPLLGYDPGCSNPRCNLYRPIKGAKLVQGQC